MEIKLKVTPRRGEAYYYSFGEIPAAKAYADELNFNDDMRDFKEIKKIELEVDGVIVKQL